MLNPKGTLFLGHPLVGIVASIVGILAFIVGIVAFIVGIVKGVPKKVSL